MKIRDRLLRWLFGPGTEVAAGVVALRIEARPRCPKCGRVLLRFQDSWLCSNCRRAVRLPGAARALRV